MREWFYLASGFALLSLICRGERRDPGALGVHSFRLWVGMALLLAVDFALNSLWEPAGHRDFRFLSLFLLALLLDEGTRRIFKGGREGSAIPLVVSPSGAALLAFSLWTIEGGPAAERYLWGLLLPIASGVFEWLLVGLRERARLSNVPQALAGLPLIFWLAMLLSLAVVN